MLTDRIKAALALTLCVVLALACSQVPLGRGTPLPGPGTVIVGLTQTQAVIEAQDAATPTPTTLSRPTATQTAPPSATQAASATSTPAATQSGSDAGASIPRLGTGETLKLASIHMLDATTGWAIGAGTSDGNDHILRTTDGAATWQDVTPPEPAPAADSQLAATAYFADADSVWAPYYDRAIAPVPGTPSVVWHTDDAGQTWTASAPLDLTDLEFSQPSDLLFVDATHGWLLTHVGAGMNHDYVVL